VLSCEPTPVPAVRERPGGDTCVPPTPQGGRRVVDRQGSTFTGRLAVDLIDPDEHAPARRDRSGLVDDDRAHIPHATLPSQVRQEAVVDGGDPQHRPEDTNDQDQGSTDHAGTDTAWEPRGGADTRDRRDHAAGDHPDQHPTPEPCVRQPEAGSDEPFTAELPQQGTDDRGDRPDGKRPEDVRRGWRHRPGLVLTGRRPRRGWKSRGGPTDRHGWPDRPGWLA
jgi:hypothetical protein